MNDNVNDENQPSSTTLSERVTSQLAERGNFNLYVGHIDLGKFEPVQNRRLRRAAVKFLSSRLNSIKQPGEAHLKAPAVI